MNTYNILQPVYEFSHVFKPEPPAKPFDVFSLSWRVVGTVKAPTINTALAHAKKAGWTAPAVEAQAGSPASQPSAKVAHSRYAAEGALA